jgi:uncharacterized protein YjaZ
MATPAEVEARLIGLSKEYDEAYKDLATADEQYLVKKSHLEIAMAKSRMKYAGLSSPTGKNYTVGEREDNALLDNATEHTELAYAEASVKASKENAKRIQLQVDIARSVAALIRSEMGNN